jgi:hypothetical protein
MVVGVIVFSLGLIGCGSNQGSTTTKSPTASSSSTSATQTATTGVSSVTSGPVRAKLSAPNHAPKAGQDWRYSVTVTDAAGHPLTGTVDIEFTFGGVVVGHDTPPTHPVKDGHWSDTLKFPADAVGHALAFQAVVHTSAGSVTLDWPIMVQK